jgi:hypothetical protein
MMHKSQPRQEDWAQWNTKERIMTRKLLLLVVLAAILGLYSTAYADTIYSQTYSIVTPDDINTADGTPPFATVLVTLNDTQNTAEFVFTAAANYVFGGADAIAINVGTFATPAATISTSGGLAPTLTGDFSNIAVSTFGKFNIIYSFVKADGTSPFNQGYFTSATIDLTGVTAKSLEKLFDPNGKGYFIAAHLRLEDAVLNPTPKHTFEAANYCDPVPVPGAVLLLGAGLVRLVGYARKRRED